MLAAWTVSIYEPKGEKGEAVAGALGLLPKGLVLLVAGEVFASVVLAAWTVSMYEPKGEKGDAVAGALGLFPKGLVLVAAGDVAASVDPAVESIVSM